MSNVTDKHRVEIVTLVDHTDKSIREIASDLNISKSVVGRVVQRYKECGSVKSLKTECGRKRITSPTDDRVLIRLSKSNPTMTANQLKGEMESHGVSLSRRTVQYRLIEGGRIPYKPIKCQVLTQQMKEKRFQWAKKHEQWTLDMWRSVSKHLKIRNNFLPSISNIIHSFSDNVFR